MNGSAIPVGGIDDVTTATFRTTWIPIINIFGWIVSVIAFAFAIIGIVNVCQGKAQELPLIGKYKLL